ncbi:MAG: acetate--CoA ligase family protein [Novosphingobium sp.]|nr:acetate--CoA ligase family protein [Novosphingobium sp.]
MLEEQYYGYQFHSRQPCAVVEQKLVLGALRDTQNIDAWLTEFFQADISQIREAEAERKTDRSGLAVAVANRALAVYGELVRASGIPCFDLGRVLRVTAADGEGVYRAAIALPIIDHMPAPLFAQLLRTSVGLVLERLATEPSPEAARELFRQLDEAVISHAVKYSPFSWTTLPMCEVAQRQNVPWRHVGRGIAKLGWGARSQLLQNSSVERDSAIGAQLSGSKQLTTMLLRSAGLPAPEHLLVRSADAAVEAARQLGWPVVVKPEHEARSEGVTINIRSEGALKDAFAKASEKNREVLIERQVAGICHRITVARGNIIYVVKRLPKSVLGDGVNTVSQLVESANAARESVPPWKRIKEFPLDDLARECLDEQGLAPDSVPAEGQRALLRPHSTDEWGGDVENLTEAIHPDNVSLVISAVEILGLAIAGVDLMTTDISRPWHENGAVIIEVNYMPQVYLRGREDEANILIPTLLGGDGRIPVHLLTGVGDLLGEARKLKSELESKGRKCHLTSAVYSEDESGREIEITVSGLFKRSLALLMRKDVHELIMVGEAAEVFSGGLAVDRLESALVIDADAERGELTARELSVRFPVRNCRQLAPETLPNG